LSNRCCTVMSMLVT